MIVAGLKRVFFRFFARVATEKRVAEWPNSCCQARTEKRRKLPTQIFKNVGISTEGEFFTLFVNKIKTSKLARGLDAKPFYEVNIQLFI